MLDPKQLHVLEAALGAVSPDVSNSGHPGRDVITRVPSVSFAEETASAGHLVGPDAARPAPDQRPAGDHPVGAAEAPRGERRIDARANVRGLLRLRREQDPQYDVLPRPFGVRVVRPTGRAVRAPSARRARSSPPRPGRAGRRRVPSPAWRPARRVRAPGHCHRSSGHLRNDGFERSSPGYLLGVRVVVTGASGNIGSAVLRELTSDGEHDVLGVARRKPFVPHESAFASVHWQAVDVARDDLDDVFAGADAVVHLAWMFQPTRRPSVTWTTNVVGTRRVLEAAGRQHVGAVVCSSSVAAYSPWTTTTRSTRAGRPTAPPTRRTPGRRRTSSGSWTPSRRTIPRPGWSGCVLPSCSSGRRPASSGASSAGRSPGPPCSTPGTSRCCRFRTGFGCRRSTPVTWRVPSPPQSTARSPVRSTSRATACCGARSWARSSTPARWTSR